MTFFAAVTWLAVLLLGLGSIGIFIAFLVTAVRGDETTEDN